jgi:hypothetical protein
VLHHNVIDVCFSFLLLVFVIVIVFNLFFDECPFLFAFLHNLIDVSFLLMFAIVFN